ncbi:hypothetical protein ACP0AK_12915 [Listeria ivanovii]|uniref:Uncharacterized protein n=1 Tax=Listeria ivanovii (strain ATCC BAA-678 / PAM 55) TaxID=881621 RepID=G2ZEF3_LISIP|nr:hypothetical protein [Listeria ivanovii]AHI56765.1 membrane protein [Listeria ivanovii WSLC3009]AIS66182.1 membrane protein [Listeria ivanovii subsp. ivanovii]MBC1760421.1 hypothetical protein [Listeria ivanovii]MBK3913798.1 hypothetical protein [Listeria ivanovii subsp. ivanovii]MBK3921364.1 hypothetical protein [Listeria ivanovii subsp. ivanovii]
MFLKSFLAGIGLAIVIFLASFLTSSYTLSSLFSIVTTILVFASIILSAFVSFGGRSGNPSRKSQLRWSILLLVAAIPSFIGFIVTFYF